MSSADWRKKSTQNQCPRTTEHQLGDAHFSSLQLGCCLARPGGTSPSLTTDLPLGLDCMWVWESRVESAALVSRPCFEMAGLVEAATHPGSVDSDDCLQNRQAGDQIRQFPPETSCLSRNRSSITNGLCVSSGRISRAVAGWRLAGTTADRSTADMRTDSRRRQQISRGSSLDGARKYFSAGIGSIAVHRSGCRGSTWNAAAGNASECCASRRQQWTHRSVHWYGSGSEW